MKTTAQLPNLFPSRLSNVRVDANNAFEQDGLIVEFEAVVNVGTSAEYTRKFRYELPENYDEQISLDLYGECGVDGQVYKVTDATNEEIAEWLSKYSPFEKWEALAYDTGESYLTALTGVDPLDTWFQIYDAWAANYKNEAIMTAIQQVMVRFLEAEGDEQIGLVNSNNFYLLDHQIRHFDKMPFVPTDFHILASLTRFWSAIVDCRENGNLTDIFEFYPAENVAKSRFKTILKFTSEVNSNLWNPGPPPKRYALRVIKTDGHRANPNCIGMGSGLAIHTKKAA